MQVETVVIEYLKVIGVVRRFGNVLFGAIKEPKEKPQKIFLLDDLNVLGKSKLKDIAAKTGHSPQNLCMLYNGLEKEGLIAREIDPENRRNTYYFITDKGKKVLEKSKKEARAVIQTIFENLSEADLKTLKSNLESTSAILEKIV